MQLAPLKFQKSPSKSSSLSNDSVEISRFIPSSHAANPKFAILPSPLSPTNSFPSLLNGRQFSQPARLYSDTDTPPRAPPKEDLDPNAVNFISRATRQFVNNEPRIRSMFWDRIIISLTTDFATDFQNIFSKTSSFQNAVQVVCEPGGLPRDSMYYPMSKENSESAAYPKPTVVLKGEKAELPYVEKIVQSLLQITWNCKLEMHLFYDHWVNKIPGRAVSRTRLSIGFDLAPKLPMFVSNFFSRRMDESQFILSSSPDTIIPAPKSGDVDGLTVSEVYERYQTMEFSYSYSSRRGYTLPCSTPTKITVKYYENNKSGEESDETFGDFLIKLSKTESMICDNPKCNVKIGNHNIFYIHGTKKITISMSESSSIFNANLVSGDPAITAWSECESCKSVTKRTLLSRESFQYSFGKYLELLCYNPTFAPTFPDTNMYLVGYCGHRNPTAIVRKYEIRNCVLEVRVSNVELYSIKLPMHVERDSKNAEMGVEKRLVSELLHFFSSVFRNIEELKNQIEHIKSSREVVLDDIGGEEELERYVLMLEDFDVKFKELELTLLALQNQYDIVRVKIKLKKSILEVVKEVELWKDEYSDKLARAANVEEVKLIWSMPEYVRNKSIHLLPDSIIEVKDDQLTTLIAYTLSSVGYRDLFDGNENTNINITVSDGRKNFNKDERPKSRTDYRSKTHFFAHNDDKKQPSHVKHEFGDETNSFICNVYFAKEFQNLREELHIKNFIQSLGGCSLWKANGGKSKAYFFKTEDDRFIVKQLTNKWTSVEKEEFLKFAPKYLKYMSENKNTTSLSRILGFYTIKHENFETKETIELDVIVMENIFAGVSVSKKFDLKGIPDRFIDDLKNHSCEVLWDGDWLTEYQSQHLLHPDSANFFDGLVNDSIFLSSCNIIDYSLLLGIDSSQKEIVVGIVDYLGSFNWSKRLESQGKIAMSPIRGRSVTILPPEEYAARFRHAIREYFDIIPDKGITE